MVDRLPRVSLHPRRSAKWTDGDDACFLGGSYGLSPDPWQAEIIASWLGRRADGRLAAGRCGVSVPRQNGKNAILEVVELFKMAVLGRKILHTAHEVKTARKAFLRLKSFFENERRWPELAALVAPGGIRRTNGQEAILLANGASIEFVARSRGSGRGFTVDDLVLDEAQELSDEQLEALLPTISAAPSGDPQIVMTGTPPPPGADGAPFRRMRDAGVEGRDKRLSWDEWSPVTAPAPDDYAALLACAESTNPSFGLRLSPSVVEDEVAAMSYSGFLRERCGSWDADSVGGVIPMLRWSSLAISPGDVPADGNVAFGVKFSPDGSRYGVGIGLSSDAGVHVEAFAPVPMAQGLSGLADWLSERWRSASMIVLDGKAGAGDLYRLLQSRGVSRRRMSVLSTPDAITAHASFLRMVNEGVLSHVGQEGLTEAVGAAGKRKIGNAGGWGWEPVTPDGDVTPLDAVTLAAHGAVIARPRTGRGRTGGNRSVGNRSGVLV